MKFNLKLKHKRTMYNWGLNNAKAIAAIVSALLLAAVLFGCGSQMLDVGESDGVQVSTTTRRNDPEVNPGQDGTIPENGVMYTGLGLELRQLGDFEGGKKKEAGEEFGEPKTGDAFVYGDYEYRFGGSFASPEGWSFSDSWNGWGVKAVSTDKEEYLPMMESIAGKPVEWMEETFRDCVKMKEAPEIPLQVKKMKGAFENCQSLVKAPEIPHGVGVMENTFYKCISLETAPEIPSSVHNLRAAFYECKKLTRAPVLPEDAKDLIATFAFCESLKEAPVIPGTVYDVSNLFYGCNNLEGTIIFNSPISITSSCFGKAGNKTGGIVLTGISPALKELAATNEEGFVVVGPEV